ncbi:MAG: hypothetical protein RLY70_1832 [Planctomycetota bacterium]
MNPFTEALESLLLTGRLTMPHPLVDASFDRARATEILVAFERDYRQELPGTPPPLAHTSALWAAERFLLACQFQIHRDVDRELVLTAIPAEAPAERSAATHYAVDLVFRFLPDLLRMVIAANANDVLAGVLTEWAHQWPLSSVGIANLDASRFELEPIVHDPCLSILYVDRIVATRDRSRVDDRRVQVWLEVLGKIFS